MFELILHHLTLSWTLMEKKQMGSDCLKGWGKSRVDVFPPTKVWGFKTL